MATKAKAESLLRVQGTVLGFNISPKGHIEGLIVETKDGREQVNFSKHGSHMLARSMPVGTQVDFNVEFETEEGVHRVYRLRDSEGEAHGKIVRLNYALHGDINGYHLDDATFLHLKPEGAKKYQFEVGDDVNAVGERREGPDAVVLEVHAIERSKRLGKRHEGVSP